MKRQFTSVIEKRAYQKARLPATPLRFMDAIFCVKEAGIRFITILRQDPSHRHTELSDFLARKICRDLAVALPD
jgi:hypothetical protein